MSPKNPPLRRRSVRTAPARHGRGLYAQRPIKAEETLGRIWGPMVDDPSADPRYVMEMDNDLYVVPKGPFRYMNHSCDPNCEIFMWEEDKIDPKLNSRPLFVGARRAIRLGEELTIDYAWPAELAIPCDCRTEKCRGWIVAPEEKHRLKD